MICPHCHQMKDSPMHEMGCINYSEELTMKYKPQFNGKLINFAKAFQKLKEAWANYVKRNHPRMCGGYRTNRDRTFAETEIWVVTGLDESKHD